MSKFVPWAIERHHLTQDDWNHGTNYRTPLWTFTRLIRGYYFDTDTSAEVAFDSVDAIIRQLEGWEEVLAVCDKEEAYTEFMSNWEKVRYPPGYGPLELAMRKALEQPLRPDRCKNRRMPRYEMFVGLAGWLQVCMGDQRILLPCEDVAETITEHGFSCTKMTVSRCRELAIKDKYLTILKGHKFRSGGFGEATEFRFDITKFEVLAAAAQKTGPEAE